MTTLDRHKYLTPDETARLLDLLDREAIVARARGHRLPVRDAMLIRLAIISGLRASELCALTIADLALVHGQPPRVHVRCGKGGKARDVPLPTVLRRPLKEYLAWMRNAGYETDGDAPLLPGRTGSPMTRSAAWKRWTAALDRAGIEHRPLHAGRHTTALTVYRATKDLRLVQRLLGHSKVSTTAIYADVLDEDVAAAQDVAWPGR